MKDLADDLHVRKSWEKWLALTRERCHLHYALEGGDLGHHISVCFNSALSTAARVAKDLHGLSPMRILEVGSSVGFNCFGLSRQFPTAMIVGIEPDVEAVEVGKVMAETSKYERLHFIPGVCEHLPFPDRYFDLIVCHTVIEHVGDVAACIGEMARVMNPNGLLHLEAPNYLWPKEPHLGILMPPLCPKPLLRLLAKIQGSGKNATYADHLKLVYPLLLERIFRRNGLIYENRVREKMYVAASGEANVIKAYHGFGRLLRIMKKMGMVEIGLNFALSFGLYPSVLYTVRHRSS